MDAAQRTDLAATAAAAAAARSIQPTKPETREWGGGRESRASNYPDTENGAPCQIIYIGQHIHKGAYGANGRGCVDKGRGGGGVSIRRFLKNCIRGTGRCRSCFD